MNAPIDFNGQAAFEIRLTHIRQAAIRQDQSGMYDAVNRAIAGFDGLVRLLQLIPLGGVRLEIQRRDGQG